MFGLTRFITPLFITCIFLIATTHARPYKDSVIRHIVVPYQSNLISGKPYQYPNKLIIEKRRVIVPVKLDMVPNFNLEKGTVSMGAQKGLPVNFADGAYPVYYMPGNANGKFNGKITLLT